MASVFASRALRQFPARQARSFRTSAPALKKKAKLVEIENLFDSGESPQADDPKKVEAPSKSHGRIKRRGLTQESRQAKFNQLLAFVTPRLGKKPAVKTPKVRKSSWAHLLQLASTQEQLEKVVELFPQWKDTGSDFGDNFGDLVAGRCNELSCPLLALKIFGDFPRYGVKMSLNSGRRLLHSLHVKYPIENTIAAASLYSVYSLPAVAQDLPSCSMLIRACLQHNSKDSLEVANALVPRLRALLEARPPLKIDKRSPKLAQDPSPLWLMSSLNQLDQVLYKRNGRKAEEWLRSWRMQSGFISSTKSHSKTA